MVFFCCCCCCCSQVTLTAAGTPQNSNSVTLKSPSAGPGGANMIQTIFSDYAPNAFPTSGVSTTAFASCAAILWNHTKGVLHVGTCAHTKSGILSALLALAASIVLGAVDQACCWFGSIPHTKHARFMTFACFRRAVLNPPPPPRAPPCMCSQAEAPFSSVYRPAQPLAGLVSGASTAAGAGGSQGVWTLTVTDTAATK
jgi:hypothetical protein